jgi:mannitol-1-phosphate 5-dehydrogenase
LAEGLENRRKQGKKDPVDIILAENMRSAADFCRVKLRQHLPDDYPLEKMVGLIETSIGKMVPIMTRADMEEDPLQVFAEPYNTLILDGKGFKGDIPDIPGLAPVENIQAWVDRKAFIHNMGHATAAYVGHYHHPAARYMYEIMDDREVWRCTRGAMLQAAQVLLKVYPSDFMKKGLVAHIDDLLHRFSNRALKDTIFRVGHDLPRKLGADDRFMGIIRMARLAKKDFDEILQAMVYGFFFDARDEAGQPHPADLEFREMLQVDFEGTLEKISGIEGLSDKDILESIRRLYADLSREYHSKTT